MARKRKPSKKAKEPKVRAARPEPELIEEEEAEMPDAVPVALAVFTAVFLIAAMIVNMLHLGGYGVGPFK